VLDLKTVELKLELDEELVESLDQLAMTEFKTRETIIKRALIAYLDRTNKMTDMKRLATRKYLNGDLHFDDFARVVGYDDALLIRGADAAIKESILNAQKDFAD